MNKPSLVILSSNDCWQLRSLTGAIADNKLEAYIKAVIFDTSDAFGLVRAKRLDVHFEILERALSSSIENYNETLLEHIEQYSPQLIVLADFNTPLTPTFLQQFQNKIIQLNTTLEDSKTLEHSVSVQWINQGANSEKMIAQEFVLASTKDTLESLEDKLHHVGYRLYPKVIQQLLKKN